MASVGKRHSWRGGVMIGTAANELLLGSDGPDSIDGGAGNDTIDGLNGDNYLRGGDGTDSIVGGADFDDINGNKGDDTIDGGPGGDDWLVGGQGNDLIIAHAGNNILYGNLGNDTLRGGSGAEILRGGQADDVVDGGAGNDWLSGDRGSDTLTGGAGADVFHSSAGAGLDLVLDFNLGEGDRVLLDPTTVYLVRQVKSDTVIDLGAGDQIVLSGVPLNSIDPTRVEVISHRELAGGGAEETIQSFDLSYGKGLRSMEFDLQVTKDGHVVLMHDLTVDRVTTGSGAVKDLTLAQILSFGVKGQPGAVVATWEDVLNWAKDHSDVHLYAEIKGFRTQADIALIYEPLRSASLEYRTSFTSFSTSDLQYLRAHGFGGEEVLWLAAQPDNFQAQMRALNGLGGPVTVGIQDTTLTVHPEDVAFARAAGVDVIVWTLTDSAQAATFLTMDVHRLLTNVMIHQTSDAGWIMG